MRKGDRIRISTRIFGYNAGYDDFTVEEFRHCLGIFRSEQDRVANNFTPLCEMLFVMVRNSSLTLGS